MLLAELTTRGLGYLIADAGVTVTGQSGGILPVLVFGAGTDYALLWCRFREELRRHEDKHDATRVALRRTGPVILASGGTVMAALLTLSLAEVSGTSGLGPIGAMGIAIAMVSMLTILPACSPSSAAERSGRSFRGSAARAPTRRTAPGAGSPSGCPRPRRVWIGTSAVLAVMIAGLRS